MPNNFRNLVGGVSINFDAIPDLQPKAIRGLIKIQKLPEENILGQAIEVTPVDSKLFKARIDDMIDLGMTPEVAMTADDPMVGDNWRWKTDQIHEYRQACKISREVGEQLLAPEGDPRRFAGQAELNRLINRVTTSIDNRREFNRASALINAFEYDPVRKADLTATNRVEISVANEKWDTTEKDIKGNLICNPFNNISAAANRLSFISGKIPQDICVTPDIITALENVNSVNRTNEIAPGKKAGARYTIRNLQVFVSQGRKNVGTDDAPVLRPLFDNVCIIGSLDQDTIAENQYDINRVEQFITADQLFYYVRYWHKSRVHVSRPGNFIFLDNVLATPYNFENIASLTY